MQTSPLAGSRSRTPAIHCIQVSKSYGALAALHEVDLTVHPGECFGLVGENGAGKTTLIKCLLDFCQPERGNVEIFGVPNTLVPSRAVLAYLPEGFSPPFHLTGEDFLLYMAHLHGHHYLQPQADAVLKRLGLDAATLERPARTYSKGTAQKLALAATLLSNKNLYVLDEPASGLDPRATALLRQEIQGLRQQAKTILLASHALADVETLCDRIAVMHRGQVRFIGTPAELVERYGGPDLEAAFLTCTADSLKHSA